MANIYKARDIYTLDQLYTKHVSHMTSEGLHSKADIAGELAYRDSQIIQLERLNKIRTDILREIREIYTGMDGFIAETAPESYQQRIIKLMYEQAIRAVNP
jgi:hypothetical protein